MRAPVNIVIVPNFYCTAWYRGLHRPPIIEVSARAKRELSAQAYEAMIQHEYGHRNMWHVEINLLHTLCWIIGIAVLLWDGWWISAACAAVLAHFMRGFLLDLEEMLADDYAIRRVGASAVHEMMWRTLHCHPELQDKTLFQRRLAAVRAKLPKEHFFSKVR